ncbi:MAG: FliH/SctL family protein [Archangium sp.]|nr:FliH/SctL family protein [Archangium sp.]
MIGTKAVPNEALKLALIDPSRIRNVAWTPSAPEPALPELTLVPPPPPPTPPPPGFVPLASAPVGPAFTPEAERQLKAAIEALNSQGQRLAEQARSDALELGILIARRIVERELSANLEGVFSLIKSAIRRVGEDHVTRVRLNSIDVIRFEAAARADFSLGTIELVADLTLEPGDVMVDTDSHTIDGRLSTRFEELVRQLDGTPK